MSLRRKVLAIVDDDLSMLRAVQALLDANGFETITFASGEEFMKKSSEIEVDCVLLDIHLGSVSGFDVKRQLEATGSKLPVIFITAIDDERVHREARSAGCVACLHKPFSARQLIDAIGKAVH